MSRYRIPALHEWYGVELGYDPPLGTFFAQVRDHARTSEEGHDESLLVLWVGMDVREITTVDALQAHIKNYARIPDDVRHSLEQDARDPGFRPNFGTALAVLFSAQRTVRQKDAARPSPTATDRSAPERRRRATEE